MSYKGRVLVVDDDADVCDVIKDVLELEDYSVEVAWDGYQAIEKIKKEEFDVVLMDIKMPGMNGVESLKHVKQIRPGLPVIMISAFAVEDLIRQALREGAFAVMKKPVDQEKLFRTIEEARGKGAMVLIADDDKTLCDYMGTILENEGYRVSKVFDGKSAVNETKSAAYDVIVIDMKLPALNGLETYLAIKEIRPDAVAVIVSGYPKEMGELAQRAVNNNAYVYIQKPIDLDDFVGLMNNIMEEKRTGQMKKPDFNSDG